MIILTRVDNKEIAINEHYIENISQAPDTIITMHSGRCYVVKESMDEIINKIKDYKLRCIGKIK